MNYEDFTYADYSKNRDKAVKELHTKKSKTKTRNIKGRKTARSRKKYKSKTAIRKTIAAIILAATLGTTIYLNNPELKKDIEFNTITMEAENIHLNSQGSIDEAIYNSVFEMLKNNNLDKYINIENNHITKDNNYSLDNYYLYQMIMGNKDCYDSFLELSFALPILNNNKINKNSVEYKEAINLLIKNADTIMFQAEEISLEKLTEALETVDTRELSDKKRNEFNELYNASLEKRISIERNRDYSSDGKTYRDEIFYSKPSEKEFSSYEKQYVAITGYSAGKSFLESKSEKRQLDGHSVITDAARIRGEVLLSTQQYNYNMNSFDKYLQKVMSDPKSSEKNIERAKKEVEELKEKEKESYSKILIKSANTVKILDNTNIKSLDFEKGSIEETRPDKDYEEKNFTNFIRDNNNKEYAIQVFNERDNKNIDKTKDKNELEDYIEITSDDIDNDNLYPDDEEIEKDNDIDRDL